MRQTRRRHLAQLGAGLTLLTLPRTASAQPWPSKSIRAIIPFTAGTTIDIVARIVFEPLSQQLGQSIIVENRGGAGGTIGAAMVARGRPGRLHDPRAFVRARGNACDLSERALRCCERFHRGRSARQLAQYPGGLARQGHQDAAGAGGRSPRQKAGGITFGTAGVGSSTHFTTERLRFSAGFEGVHVPFRGMPEVLTEVMTGRVDFCYSTIAPRCRSSATASSSRSRSRRRSAVPRCRTCRPRSSSATRIPTTPSGTGCSCPRRRRARSSTAAPGGAARPPTCPPSARSWAQQGIDPMPMTAAEFDAQIKREIAESIALVKAAGIKVN